MTMENAKEKREDKENNEDGVE